MRNYTYQISQLEKELKEIKASLKVSTKFTQEFLNKCGEKGIKGVSIGMRSDRIESTKGYPFGHSGSVFSHPVGVKGDTGWPAIWQVVEEMKISGGAGNSDQHQVSNDNLIEGVYELKGKTWRKVE